MTNSVQQSPLRLGAQLKAALAAASVAQLRKHMCEVAEIMGSRLPPHLQLVEASRQAQLSKSRNVHRSAAPNASAI